jgi:hypothetical protein
VSVSPLLNFLILLSMWPKDATVFAGSLVLDFGLDAGRTNAEMRPIRCLRKEEAWKEHLTFQIDHRKQTKTLILQVLWLLTFCLV